MVVSAAPTASRGQAGNNMSLSRQTSGSQPSASAVPASGKQIQCRVDFLDDQHYVFRLPPKTLGQRLFDQVCEHLGLLETDYFGLEYSDSVGNKYWLDLEKSIGRQLAYKMPSSNILHVHFGVKFYTPDPVQLEEECTRYLFVLQIRKDLASGLMPCQDTTAALLAAYVVQAEEGDYSADNYRDYTYLLKYKFLPQQDVTFLSLVRDSHLQVVGQSPAEADLNFLETARRCEMYGIKMHAANDHENVALNLAVAHMGIVVFQNHQKINIFSWAKIRKLSFKRKRFLIKLHPEGYGYYKDTVEFFFDSRNSCKNFWKKCIEHHGFFRCPMVQTLPRSKTKIFPAGSSFRFSGRTQKQVLEFARDNYGKRPSFHRGTGSSRIRSSQSCGASLAATPLLPMARARDSRYNTTGGTRSRRSQQGENGALARSKSEPMEVAEVMNPDRSSDSGSRTLERGRRADASQEMPMSSNEHVPGDYQPRTGSIHIERYEEYRSANGHVQEVAVTVEGEVVPSRRISRDSAVHVFSHEEIEVGLRKEEEEEEEEHPPLDGNGGGNGGGDSNGGGYGVGGSNGDVLARVDSLTGVDINKDIPYVLYRRHIHRDKATTTTGTTPRVGRRQQFVKTTASKDPDGNMIYYMEAHKMTPDSPHLYTSSKRVPTPPNKFRILDYVNRKSLPPEGNFSYEDDSASIDSMERELFENLKQKYLQRMRQIREKSQSQESISSNESGGSSTSADSYDTVSLEELTNMRNLSQIFDQVYASGNESAAFSSTTSINTVESMRSMPQWDPQTEAEIQHMAGVISTAFQHADDEDTDLVIEPPNGFGDVDTLKAKHRRESYEMAINEAHGRPSLTGSQISQGPLAGSQAPPIPPKPPKLTVLAKFAQYSQSIRDSFDLSDMDLRVFDERSYSDIQQTIKETCTIGLDRVTSSENMSSTSEDPLDVPEICVKKIRQLTRTVNVHTETSSTSSSDSAKNCTVIHDLPSPSQLVAEPLDISDIVEIPDVPEEFRDVPSDNSKTVVASPVVERTERAEPPEYQAWKAQMKELEQLTGAKSSNEPSPVTPSGASQRSAGSSYRGFTRRTPIGSTWLYRATSSDPDWEDSETSASDTQRPSTSRGRSRNTGSPTPPKSNYLIKEIPIHSSNLHSTQKSSTFDRALLGNGHSSSSGVYGGGGFSTGRRSGGGGAYSVANELEELTKKINGWKQQSQESFLKSFDSHGKSLAESMRTLPDDSMDGRKRRNPADLAYFVAKEILNGERTYKTDLEVICVHLKRELEEAEDIPQGLFQTVFSLLQPIYESQGTLLVEIDHRLSTWDSRSANMHRVPVDDVGRIGDLLLKQNDALDQYQAFLTRLPDILAELNDAFRKNKTFELFYRNFEQAKFCYLPLAAFLLKPAQRLFQYQGSLERLLNHYPTYHSDIGNCEAALQNFRRTSGTVHEAVSQAENFTKLVDLQRDLVGIDNLALATREFIREGCLLKLSKKGYQLRMFILLTDVLLYTNRISNTTGQFKLHGQVSVRGMMVEDADPREGMEHCFTLYGGNRALLLAANTAEEKTRWLHDLHTAVDQSKRLAYDKLLQYGSLKSYSSSDEVLDKFDAFPVSPAHTTASDADTLRTKSPSERSVASARSNTTMHVCWHRQTTVSVRELSRAFQLQMSGYLLRKLKTSDGWQKLWVVFTDFCLFFFKNNHENAPIASLPLIGYRVAVPSLEDNILKDHVFKLSFTSHKYFFRTDSEYSFNRWMEVLDMATQPDGQNISPDMNGTGMHV